MINTQFDTYNPLFINSSFNFINLQNRIQTDIIIKKYNIFKVYHEIVKQWGAHF